MALSEWHRMMRQAFGMTAEQWAVLKREQDEATAIRKAWSPRKAVEDGRKTEIRYGYGD